MAANARDMTGREDAAGTPEAMGLEVVAVVLAASEAVEASLAPELSWRLTPRGTGS